MAINIHVFHCRFTLCQIRLKMRKIFSSARVKIITKMHELFNNASYIGMQNVQIMSS